MTNNFFTDSYITILFTLNPQLIIKIIFYSETVTYFILE